MKDRIKTIKDSVIHISCNKKEGESWGTGFVVSQDGYVLTAFHVIGDISLNERLEHINEFAKDIKVFVGGQEMPAHIAIDTNDPLPGLYDFALLKIEHIRNVHFLNLGRYDDVDEGSEIFFTGLPKARLHVQSTHKAMVSAKVKDRNINCLVLDTICSTGGLSGAPVISMDSNNVVGILSKGGWGKMPDLLKQTKNRIIDFVKEEGPNLFINGKGIIPLVAIYEIINTMEKYSSVGIAYATSIEYAKSYIERLNINK